MSKQTYIPDNLPLPLEKLELTSLIRDISNANSALSTYDGILRAIPNPRVLLSTLIDQEADLSSRIEGTQASYKDVLDQEAGKPPATSRQENDIKEIINYRTAMITAQAYLEEGRRLSLSLILELHQQLLTSVRGQDKSPGEFRKEQNWIGTEGSTIDNAIFVPPSPIVLSTALENWEQYISYDEVDPIVQTAILHAQFELIHPFKDGNGRIGRLLIPLTLYKKNRLNTPNFYLSEVLESKRGEYYERLNNISSHRDWNGWIKFFLQAVNSQAKSNIIKVEAILELHNEMKKEIVAATNSPYSSALTDFIFIRPIFNSGHVQSYITEQHGSSVGRTTIHTNLNKLIDAKILRITRKGSGSAPSIYSFDQLLKIIK
ncbi:MAG TPA: Fic/DOC family N-terminal domain-containing protein [Oligella sp.]|nr:Fic/DOC family N-terminal domain-containing protein [Oligella sp.]